MAPNQDMWAVGPFVKGLLATVALGVFIATTSTAGLSTVLPLAMGMGFVVAVFELAAWINRSWVSELFYSGLGVVGFIGSASSFLRTTDCSALPAPAFRFAAFALLVAVAAVAVFMSVVRLGRGMSAAVGLGLFGALEVLISLSTFLESASSSWLRFVVMIPAAAALGWFAVTHTDAVLGIATVAVAYLTVFASQVEDSCSAVDLSGVVLIVGFCITYFITTRLVAVFRSR
ncbi:hypothetical protein ACQ86B_29140 (plasmid) [Mycolicibacterium aichiense]|uniref:hypothetical protein n=1 Tax=Mycolicibacterium aichiense TaxID=1799 RepID=UPI003D67ACCE